MRKVFTCIIFLFLAATSFGQLSKKVMKNLGRNPIVFLDSLEINMSELEKLNPSNISNIRILKRKKAKKFLGDQGVDGAIYITTVKAAKTIYWNFFRGKSNEYKQLLNSPQADTIVQYVLNGEALSDSAVPGSLFLINDNNFKSISIIDKASGKFLMDNVIPKRYIVVITSKRLKGVVKNRNRR